MAMKHLLRYAVFWDIASQCIYCKNQYLGEIYYLQLQDEKSPWFTARMYLTMDGKESPLQRYLHPSRQHLTLFPPWKHEILQASPCLNHFWIGKVSEKWRMPSFGIWRRVALARTKDSEERIATNIRMQRIGELGITRAMRRHIAADWVLRCLRRENLKSYRSQKMFTYTDITICLI
jgi:hypothetical protein